MADFEAKTVCILGRQPALGLAELEARYGDEHIKPIPGAALLDIEAGEINFKTLGGTIRVAKILSILPYTDWSKIYKYLAGNIPKHLEHLPDGSFTLGVSLYDIDVSLGKLNADLLSIKKIVRATGRSTRTVPNKTPELNAAQVLRNQLTKIGGWELLLVKNGTQTILAQTMFIQDIDDYAARDQKRPKRDARVGMLPPKLAQIIVNLATGDFERKQREAQLSGVQGAVEQRTETYEKSTSKEQSQTATKQSARSDSGVAGSAGQQAGAVRLRVLDPFCGTGVILQEALLMGYSVIGTDLEPRMVEYSQANIAWLIDKSPKIEGYVDIEVGDATDFTWPRFSAVATETYLGRPLSSLPPKAKLDEIIKDVNTIIKKFLQNLAPQLKPNQRLCLAVPAWRLKFGFKHLPLIDHLTEMGYNRLTLVHVKNDDLIYFRENQLVARELLILKKV